MFKLFVFFLTLVCLPLAGWREAPERIASALSALVAATVDTVQARVLVCAAEELLQDEDRASVDSALVLLRQAVRLAPAYEPALVALAEAHFTRADLFGLDPVWYDSAAVYAERVVPLNPARGWVLLGQVYGLKGEHAFALEALQKSVAHDSLYFPAVVGLGYRYFDLG